MILFEPVVAVLICIAAAAKLRVISLGARGLIRFGCCLADQKLVEPALVAVVRRVCVGAAAESGCVGGAPFP